VGVYNGFVSYPGVQEAIESSDFIINTGPLLSDSNTGGFTRFIKPHQVVEIHSDHVILQGQKYTDTAIKSRIAPSALLSLLVLQLILILSQSSIIF
jgi:pyruvate decarboxylase